MYIARFICSNREFMLILNFVLLVDNCVLISDDVIFELETSVQLISS